MGDSGDSVEDEVGRAARTALTVALQMGDRIARIREELAGETLRAGEAQQRALGARFVAERDVARAQLAVVDRPGWWQRAGLHQIADVFQTAQQWNDLDPVAQRATQTIAHQVKDRFGLDVAEITDTVHADQAARPAGRDETSAGLSRAQGLTVVAAAETTDRVLDPAAVDRLNEVEALISKDPVVDAVIAEKFPQLFTDDQRSTSQVARRENVEANVDYAAAAALMDEAERLDARAASERLDASRARRDDPGRVEDTGRTEQAAAVLELQAREYELHADQGGTAVHQPDELRQLAADARSQAHLSRQGQPDSQQNQSALAQSGAEVAAVSVQGNATAVRGESEIRYDSVERRHRIAVDMQARGIPQETIDVRMRAEIAQARPAAQALQGGGRVHIPVTNRGRSPGRNAERGEQGR